jgi:hypothetical protein
MYKGCRFNVKVEWANGEQTWEPLNMIGKDDPVLIGQYASKNNLLHVPVWDKYQRIIKNNKILQKVIKNVSVF